MLESSDINKQSTQMTSAHIEEARHEKDMDSPAPNHRYEHTTAHKALVWKQDLRIIPLCAFIYLLCYLDRSNIGQSEASSHLIDKSLIWLQGMPRRSTPMSGTIFLQRLV